MEKRKLIIAVGRHHERLLDRMKEHKILFAQVRFEPAGDLSEYISLLANDVSEMFRTDSDCMHPVVVTGITSHDDFLSFLRRLTGRCNYHIVSMCTHQVDIREFIHVLENSTIGVFRRMQGVMIYAADRIAKE